jgi:hypothetical protein
MPSEILKTYGDVTIKPDVVAFVELITALETYFLGNLGKSQAYGPVHQTQIDTLPAVGSLAVAEGEDLSSAAVTTPSLLTNIVEHVARTFQVSDVQKKVAHFSGEDMLAYQTVKAAKEIGNAMEFDIIRSTLTSGQSGTVPKMKGIVQSVSKSTNTTVHNSGTVLSASIINGLMKANWDNSNGNVATDLFMGSFLRNVVDGFTQKSNSLINVPANTIDNMVDVYQTSFGRINVHVHRYVQSTTAGGLGSESTGRLLAVNPAYLKIAYLNPIYMIDLAKTGASYKKAYVSDLTVEVKNQDPHWNATGFDID